MTAGIDLDREKIADFCRRWKIKELALFGSVLREDFTPESDVDVLVTFEPGEEWTLLDVVRMQNGLSGIIGRNVDLVLRENLVNPFRRHHILKTKMKIDVALGTGPGLSLGHAGRCRASGVLRRGRQSRRLPFRREDAGRGRAQPHHHRRGRPEAEPGLPACPSGDTALAISSAFAISSCMTTGRSTTGGSGALSPSASRP